MISFQPSLNWDIGGHERARRATSGHSGNHCSEFVAKIRGSVFPIGGKTNPNEDIRGHGLRSGCHEQLRLRAVPFARCANHGRTV